MVPLLRPSHILAGWGADSVKGRYPIGRALLICNRMISAERWGVRQAETGANLPVIERSLNHKSTQTTAIDVRLWMEPVRNSTETATKAMLLAGGCLQQAVPSLTRPRRSDCRLRRKNTGSQSLILCKWSHWCEVLARFRNAFSQHRCAGLPRHMWRVDVFNDLP